MNGYLLDTNILSDMIRNPFGLASQRVEQIDPKKIFTSIIVASELRYGCAKKKSEKLLARVVSILKTVTVLPLDTPADTEYGRIRAELEVAGQSIGSNDLLIGAHALALDMTLVTDNVREFCRIRNLNIENWLDGTAF